MGRCNEERIPPVLRTGPLPLEGGEIPFRFRRKGGAKRMRTQRDEGMTFGSLQRRTHPPVLRTGPLPAEGGGAKADARSALVFPLPEEGGLRGDGFCVAATKSTSPVLRTDPSLRKEVEQKRTRVPRLSSPFQRKGD